MLAKYLRIAPVARFIYQVTRSIFQVARSIFQVARSMFQVARSIFPVARSIFQVARCISCAAHGSCHPLRSSKRPAIAVFPAPCVAAEARGRVWIRDWSTARQ